MIEIAFNNNETQINIALALQAQYPQHLILIESGNWLHAFNEGAYLLHVLKKYKIRLEGPATKPHLMAGFPKGKPNVHLWPLVNEHQIAYVIYAKAKGVTLSDNEPGPLLSTIQPDIVNQVINDLVTDKQLRTAATAQALANPETQDFIFKAKACELDEIILKDLFKLSRETRATWGENVRQTMHRFMRNVYLYGNEENKPKLLRHLSADLDLLTHYLCQAKTLNRFKHSFEHRAGLVVELGRLLGGLQRARKAAP